MNNIGSILASLRSEKHLSQKELADRLRDYGFDVTNQAISKWETGTTQPNVSQFLALCAIYEVPDVMALFTGKGSEGILSGLNRRGKERAMEYIRLLRGSEEYRANPSVISLRAARQLPLYRIAASAGTGQFLDSDDYEMVEVGEDVPDSAAFGVRLAGDSMEPDFQNGDIVWVSQQQMVQPGQIGIFLWQGDVFCKRLAVSSGKIRLESLNPAYSPIEVDEDSDYRVFGRVVGHCVMGL